MMRLFSEFVGDGTVYQGDKKVEPRDHVLQSLVSDLINAFDLDDPTEHGVFQGVQALKADGFYKLATFHTKGIKHLDDLLSQYVNKTEKEVTEGRLHKDLPYMKVSEYKSLSKISSS